MTEFNRRVYRRFLALAGEGQELSLSAVAQDFSQSETAEIVRIVNGGGVSGRDDLSALAERIRQESFRTRPSEAGALSNEELLAQISMLRQKKS